MVNDLLVGDNSRFSEQYFYVCFKLFALKKLNFGMNRKFVVNFYS